MALAEKMVREVAARTPQRYGARVRWMAVIYLGLNLISIFIIVAIVWRVQFFITVAQRSNVETLTLLIVLVLAAYYVLTTFRGFLGALRILWLNAPQLWSKDTAAVERRKHDALKSGGEPKSAYFDKAIYLQGKHGEPVTWEVGDDVARLGTLVLNGVEATYMPIKDGMNNGIFEFLAGQLEQHLKKRDPETEIQITRWSSIDEDEAATYYSMVRAFQNLEAQLGKGEIWPSLEITEQDHSDIQRQLRALVPALRNEGQLPDVEYEVEYDVPVLPEPLGFLRLTRRESRADPIASMGCAGFVMLTVLLVITLFIILPPWVPSK